MKKKKAKTKEKEKPNKWIKTESIQRSRQVNFLATKSRMTAASTTTTLSQGAEIGYIHLENFWLWLPPNFIWVVENRLHPGVSLFKRISFVRGATYLRLVREADRQSCRWPREKRRLVCCHTLWWCTNGVLNSNSFDFASLQIHLWEWSR